MAYTSIIPIRHLNNTVKYVQDKQKTSLSAAVDYALNRDKTEQDVFEMGICCMTDSAYKDMMMTKERFNKLDGVQGYHLVQSFAEGEVTPEVAHKIGLEFAERLFGNKYELVVATHLNTHCYHNHIVCNSVSFVDGKKYHSNARSYYTEVRQISDELCIKHGLSVIATPENIQGKHNYSKWSAEQNGQPTWRTAIKKDIDDAIEVSLTWKMFVAAMAKKGYTMRFDRKHYILKPPGKERFVRFKTLGTRYTPNAITQRIIEPKNMYVPPKQAAQSMRYGKIRGNPFKVHKNSSLIALYYHYLYLIGAFPKRKPQRVSYALRQEIYKLDKRIEQMQYLSKNKFHTREQLAQHRENSLQKIAELTAQRSELYRAKEGKEKYEPLTKQLEALRYEVKMCDGIISQSVEMEKKMMQNSKIINELNEKQQQPNKSAKQQNKTVR